MSNFNQHPMQIFVAEINAINPGLNLLRDELGPMGNPVAGTEPGKNTDITMNTTAHPGGRFVVPSSQTFHYNRLNLQTQVIDQGNSNFFRSASMASLDHLKAAIVERYGIEALIINDLTFSAWPAAVEDGSVVTITVGANNPLFLAGDAQVNIVDPVALDVFAANTILDGPTYTYPVGDSQP